MNRTLKIILLVVGITIFFIGSSVLLIAAVRSGAGEAPQKLAQSMPSVQQSKCYLAIVLNAEKKGGQVMWSLDKTSGMELLNGFYDELVRVHKDDAPPFILRSLDESGKELGSYDLYAYFIGVRERVTKKGLSGSLISTSNLPVRSVVPYSTNVATLTISDYASSAELARFTVTVDRGKCSN
jgi:hypothetical protein